MPVVCCGAGCGYEELNKSPLSLFWFGSFWWSTNIIKQWQLFKGEIGCEARRSFGSAPWTLSHDCIVLRRGFNKVQQPQQRNTFLVIKHVSVRDEGFFFVVTNSKKNAQYIVPAARSCCHDHQRQRYCSSVTGDKTTTEGKGDWSEIERVREKAVKWEVIASSLAGKPRGKEKSFSDQRLV